MGHFHLVRQSRSLFRTFIACAMLMATWAILGIAHAQQRAEVVLNHLTTGAGLGEYEWSLATDRMLAKNSSWLRQRAQPTQGYIFNLRTAIDSKDQWNTLVFNMDPVSPWLAEKGQPPFPNGMAGLELRALTNATWPIWLLFTKTPNVKSVQDLPGRRVALGPKAGTATLMMEETLKAAGVFDKVKLQYLSFSDITDGLLNDTIDVGMGNFWYNPADDKIGPTQGTINLQASGKPFHYVLIDKATLMKTRDVRGVPYRILDLPNKTLPFQTVPMAVYANADYVAVSRDFPEEQAYEYTRLFIKHLPDVMATGGIASVFTPKFLPYGLTNLHPGAARAYREAGLIK